MLGKHHYHTSISSSKSYFMDILPHFKFSLNWPLGLGADSVYKLRCPSVTCPRLETLFPGGLLVEGSVAEAVGISDR